MAPPRRRATDGARPRAWRPPRWLQAAGLGALASVACLGVAAAFDPQAPVVLVVGTAGSGPCDRLTPERSGRSATSLPHAPTALWRIELDAGLEAAPVVDAQGAVVVALTSSEVLKLAPDGRELWRQKLGNASAVVPPVQASDGSVFVLATDNRLWSLSPAGNVRFALELGPGARRADAAPLARDDGGVVLATEDELVHVDGEGRVVARAKLPERPSGGLLAWNGGTLVTAVGGAVLAWRSPGAPRVVGNFGANLSGGALLATPRTLVGVADGVLLALDLPSGLVEILGGSGDVLRHFEGPPALAPGGELVVTTLGGELFALDLHGAPVRRLALDPGIVGFDVDGGAPFFLRGELRESPPLVVDPAGRVAFVRGSGRVAVVDEHGAVHDASTRFCSRPLAVVPAGPGRFVVACRSGTLGMFGDGEG
ncbi:MAG: PQQ-binding-like beta-propeller repeat protein [Polyangiaceae bacterium]|nr:PQQ-binding-like beta-propeller repeat protein [Polyangiaceae bacterium]